MGPTHTIGFVWPGPPVPGDAEEVARFVPDGVDWHIAGTPPDFEPDAPPAITRERLVAIAENPNIEMTAAKLPAHGVQAIGYGCTSASYVRGVGGDKDISTRINGATGLPSTTTSTTAVEALNLLGVTRVAVLSPHVDELNERLRAFMEGHGLEVVHLRGLNKLRGIEHIPQEDIYELVVQLVDRPGSGRHLHKLHRHEIVDHPRPPRRNHRQTRRLRPAGHDLGHPPSSQGPR